MKHVKRFLDFLDAAMDAVINIKDVSLISLNISQKSLKKRLIEDWLIRELGLT